MLSGAYFTKQFSDYKGNATRSRSSPGILLGSILPLCDEKKHWNPLKSPDGADLALDVIASMGVIEIEIGTVFEASPDFSGAPDGADLGSQNVLQ